MLPHCLAEPPNCKMGRPLVIEICMFPLPLLLYGMIWSSPLRVFIILLPIIWMQLELLDPFPPHMSLRLLDGDGSWRKTLPPHFPPPFPNTIQVWSDGWAFTYIDLLFALPSLVQDRSVEVDLELIPGLEHAEGMWDLHWSQRLGATISFEDQ